LGWHFSPVLDPKPNGDIFAERRIGPMPTYVTLYNWTEQGVKNIKESPARLEAAVKATEAAGGKVLGIYVTMGAYDLVAFSEWPSDELVAAGALAISSLGNVRTTTLRAFTPAEFAEIVKKIP
jgi:uncharacterized protein with GYD domain